MAPSPQPALPICTEHVPPGSTMSFSYALLCQPTISLTPTPDRRLQEGGIGSSHHACNRTGAQQGLRRHLLNKPMNLEVQGIYMMMIFKPSHLPWLLHNTTAKPSVQTFPGFPCPETNNFAAHTTDYVLPESLGSAGWEPGSLHFHLLLQEGRKSLLPHLPANHHKDRISRCSGRQ